MRKGWRSVGEAVKGRNSRLTPPLCRSGGTAGDGSGRYESREKINAAAQRTLITDSGSETQSNVYESYGAVRVRVHNTGYTVDNVSIHRQWAGGCGPN
jgi:hypothetical protein